MKLAILVLCFVICFAGHESECSTHRDHTISSINGNVSTTASRRNFLSFLFGSEPFKFIKHSISKIFRRRHHKSTTVTTSATTKAFSPGKPTTTVHRPGTSIAYEWVKVLKATLKKLAEISGEQYGYDRYSISPEVPTAESKPKIAPYIPYTRQFSTFIQRVYSLKHATLERKPQKYDPIDELTIGDITDAHARYYTFTQWRTKSRYYNTPPLAGGYQNQYPLYTMAPRTDYHPSMRYRSPRTYRTYQDLYYTRKPSYATTKRFEQPYELYYTKQGTTYPQTQHTTGSNKSFESESTSKATTAQLEHTTRKTTYPSSETHSRHTTQAIYSKFSLSRDTHTAERSKVHHSSHKQIHNTDKTDSTDKIPSQYISHGVIHTTHKPELHHSSPKETHHTDRRRDYVTKQDTKTLKPQGPDDSATIPHFHTKHTSPSISTVWQDVPKSLSYFVKQDVPHTASGRKQEQRFTFLHQYGRTRKKLDRSANSLQDELEYHSISRSLEITVPDVLGDISGIVKSASKKRAILDNYLRGGKSFASEESKNVAINDKADLSYWYFYTGSVPDEKNLILVTRRRYDSMEETVPLIRRKIINPEFYRRFIMTRFYSKLYEDVEIPRTSKYVTRPIVHETTSTTRSPPLETGTTIPAFPTYIGDISRNIDPYGLLKKIRLYNMMRQLSSRNGTREIAPSRLHPINHLPPYFHLPYTLPMNTLFYTDGPEEQQFTFMGKFRLHDDNRTFEMVQRANEFPVLLPPPTQSGFIQIVQKYRINENKTVETLAPDHSRGDIVPYKKDRTVVFEVKFFPLRTQPTPLLMKEDMSVFP